MTTILVIEDDEHIRYELIDWLQFEGYNVIGAENGRIGLEAALRDPPELILCDIAMPEMNGYDVLTEVRASAALGNVPFIFLTAAADRVSRRKGMDGGADDYLAKPFTHAEVLNAVRSRLSKRAAQEREIRRRIDALDQAFQEQTQRHLLKSRLVAMIAHDFRNILASILWSSEMLVDEENLLTLERKQRQHDRVRGSVHALLQMLDEMLMVAEMESGHLHFQPQAVDLALEVNSLVDEFRLIDQGAHPMSCECALQGEVEVDLKLIRQILSNLMANALKYSPPQTEVAVRLSVQDGEIVFEVRDRGIGIPPEGCAAIFEPFYRASNANHIKGTGLGLTIVKECVDHHHGTIVVDSEVGRGTTFIVRLPYK